MLFGNNILLFCLRMPFECHVNSFPWRCHICRNMPLWVSRRADCVGWTREKFEANIHCQTAYFAVVIDSCLELLVPPGAAFPVPDWQLNTWRDIMINAESRFCPQQLEESCQNVEVSQRTLGGSLRHLLAVWQSRAASLSLKRQGWSTSESLLIQRGGEMRLLKTVFSYVHSLALNFVLPDHVRLRQQNWSI